MLFIDLFTTFKNFQEIANKHKIRTLNRHR